MAKPVVLTASAGASSPYSTVWIPNRHDTPFNIGWGAVVTGTVTYSVQYTYDDPIFVASPTWLTYANAANLTTSSDGAITNPVAAIRLNASAGTGSVRATFIQAGISAVGG